jgi:hypothetical protein
MLVPLVVLVAVVDPIHVLKMLVPGAATLTAAPKLDLAASEPSRCRLATVMMHLGLVAGRTAWQQQAAQAAACGSTL